MWMPREDQVQNNLEQRYGIKTPGRPGRPAGGMKVAIIALLIFSIQHDEILAQSNNWHFAMTSIGIRLAVLGRRQPHNLRFKWTADKTVHLRRDTYSYHYIWTCVKKKINIWYNSAIYSIIASNWKIDDYIRDKILNDSAGRKKWKTNWKSFSYCLRGWWRPARFVLRSI